MKKIIPLTETNQRTETTIDINMVEILAMVEEKWNSFLRTLAQMTALKTVNLSGTDIPINNAAERRLSNLLYVLFEIVQAENINLTRDFFMKTPSRFQQRYASFFTINDQPIIAVDTKQVIDAFNDDGQGVFIRQVSKERFMSDDWLSIMSHGPKTRLLSATFVLHDIPIALIGQVPSSSNEKWKEISGLIFSCRTHCQFSGKSDMNSDLYYLLRTGTTTWRVDKKVLTDTGEIDYEKLYEKNKFLKEYSAKVKKNVDELRNKVIEQRNRAKSNANEYTTKSGKIKPNIEKESVEQHGVLINNEALLAPNRDDIIGVYINTETTFGIIQALEIQTFLAKQGIHVGLFDYTPTKNPALTPITRESLLENPELAFKIKHHALTFHSKYHALDNLCHHHGWLPITQHVVSNSDTFKITLYKKDDPFVLPFIQRFFERISHAIKQTNNNYYECEFNISVDEAQQILAKHLASNEWFHLKIESASPEETTLAHTLHHTLSAVPVPAVIPRGALPYIEANNTGVFINFSFFYNKYDAIRNDHLISGQYTDYYNTLVFALNKIDIALPKDMYTFHVLPVVDLRHPEIRNNIFANVYSKTGPQLLSATELEHNQTKLNHVFRTLGIPDCALRQNKETGGFYLEFPDHVNAEDLRRYYYILMSTIGLAGDMSSPRKNEKGVFKPAIIYLASLGSIIEVIDKNNSLNESTRRFSK